MRFVDDEGVVLRQPAVVLDFRQQDAVGHELDRGGVADRVVEAHLVADRAAQRHLQLFRHPPRHRTRGDAARLGAADHAGRAAPGQQAQLGQLGSLAAAGFTGDHHYLVAADQLDDALGFGADRQGFIDLGRRQAGRAALALGDRGLQLRRERIAQTGIGRLRLPLRPQAEQATTVAAERAIDGLPQLPGWQLVVGRYRLHGSV